MDGDVNQLLMQNDNAGQQFLTFLLDNEEYGVDILTVQEIRGWEKTTTIPNSPAHMLGVINLRGIIVPVIHLRKCFNLEEVDFTANTVVIVVKVAHEDGERTVGLVVDAVSDVHLITDKDINKSPSMGNSLNSKFIKGLASVNDKMVILLSIDELINEGILDDVSKINVNETES